MYVSPCPSQTMSHLLCCQQLNSPVTANDLSAAKDVAILCVDHWRDTMKKKKKPLY